MPHLNADKTEAISEAVRTILLKGAAADKQAIDGAVDALVKEYTGIDKNLVWPVAVYVLAALGSLPPDRRDSAKMKALVAAMTDDQDDKDKLSAAIDHNTVKEALLKVEASPLGYTNDCQIAHVVVDGHPAVYLYAGFTTQVPFDVLAGWLNPSEWHDRSPVLFRSVASVTRHLTQAVGAYDLWHESFREKATPFPNNDVVTNVLACNNASSRTGGFSITSYDLDRWSPQDVLVDCGYLMIRDLGDMRAAGFVKIIGFKDAEKNGLIEAAKPLWLSLIRAVAEGDAESPAAGAKLAADAPESDDGQTSVSALVQGWVDAANSCYAASGKLAGNVVGGFTGPSFGWDDFRRNVTGYWSDIARHYVDAWSAMQNAVSQVAPSPAARAAQAATSVRSAAMSPSVATAWVPVRPATRVGDSVKLTDLVLIADTTVVVPAAKIAGRIVADGDQRLLALQVDARNLGRGVYVGTATVGGLPDPVPTFVFVSGATVTSPA